MKLLNRYAKEKKGNKLIVKLLINTLVCTFISSSILPGMGYAAKSTSTYNESEVAQDIKDDGKRIWNLDDVDILALIGEISRITGKNFLIDPRVASSGSKVSLVSNEAMTNEQAYNAFLSILQVSGFATIESGSLIKIVPSSVAKQFDTKVNVEDLAGLGDEMVVQVIAVKHVTATALIPILRNLVNQQGHIAPYSPSNVIVIADHASNVKRIKEIINRIDQESSEDIEIAQLRDASSEEVVKVITNLMSRNQQLGEPVTQQIKLAADTRTNSILISGDKEKRLKIRALIAQMDVPTPNTGDTEVVYLQYQNAGDLVPVLSTIIDSYYEKKGVKSPTSATNTRSSAGSPTRAGSTSSNSSSSNSSNGGVTSTLELGDIRRDEGSVSAPGIISEPNTNALVITAPQELMRSIKAVIAKLDIKRHQVLVEALIVEVSLEHHLDFGIEWRLPSDGRGFTGGTNFGDPNSSTSTTGIINGANASTTADGDANALSSSLLRSLPLSGLTVGFIQAGDIRAVVHSLAQDINTNILSTPSLLTMDNQTAEIVVAQEIPFQTNSITNASSETGNITNSFDYREVGLKLKITPMITKGDAVRLAIEQETGNVQTPGVTPTTSKRTIKTVVSVDDKNILVLGGLIQGQKDAGESKLPILGDLPIIGNLFKRKADQLTKRNLMVFIRPVVIRDSEQSYNVSVSKYDLMRDGQLLYKVDPYGKIARDMMPEMPDLNKKLPHDKQKLNLPSPFISNNFVDDIIEDPIFD